jgi:hypothetical protein
VRNCLTSFDHFSFPQNNCHAVERTREYSSFEPYVETVPASTRGMGSKGGQLGNVSGHYPYLSFDHPPSCHLTPQPRHQYIHLTHSWLALYHPPSPRLTPPPRHQSRFGVMLPLWRRALVTLFSGTAKLFAKIV